MLRAFQQACEQAVFRFDGTVVQCNEQGLLACFGYPVAYEDAARRAARAGLGILEELKALGERLRREHNAGAESVGRHPHRARPSWRRGRRRSRWWGRPATWRSGWRTWPSPARSSAPRPRTG